MKSTQFPKSVPPLASLPRCESCGKRFMPALPLVTTCFVCESKARRAEKARRCT